MKQSEHARLMTAQITRCKAHTAREVEEATQYYRAEVRRLQSYLDLVLDEPDEQAQSHKAVKSYIIGECVA